MSKKPDRISKLTWVYISGAGSLIFFVLAALMILFAPQVTVMGITKSIYYIVLVPVGLTSAAFLFGALRSSAKYSGNNYSTLARVLYVDQCIRKHRRELKEPLYACACMIDKIAEQLTFEEYEKAQTYLSAKAVAGEKGAIFRTEEAKASREQLEKAISEAESACFVK